MSSPPTRPGEHSASEPSDEEAEAPAPSTTLPTTACDPEQTAAVILAAGEGSRFTGKTHKLLAPLKGKPVVVWAVESARAAGFAETIVVMGAVDLADALPSDVTVLLNHDWADGQARSLQVAVSYAGAVGHVAIVVGLGDQPFVPTSAWMAVGAASKPIATATYDDKSSPPVRLHGDVWGLLPISGDEGARGLIRRRPELVEPIPCEGLATDVDTSDDLATLNRRKLPEALAHGSDQ